jgi:hypothetical protein
MAHAVIERGDVALELLLDSGDTIVVDGDAYQIVRVGSGEVQLAVPGSDLDGVQSADTLAQMFEDAEDIHIHR